MANNRFSRMARYCLTILSLATLVSLSGCGDSGGDVSSKTTKYLPEDADQSAAIQVAAADQGSEGSQTPAGGNTSGFSPPPVRPSTTLNSGASTSLDVPDGKPEEILAFIQQLENTEIQGQTEEEALAQFKKVHHARIAGCDKILAGQTTPEIRVTAVHTKINALQMLAENGEPEAREQLVALGTSLQTDSSAELARLGRLLLFGMKVDAVVTGQNQNFDELKNDLNGLLADPNSHAHVAEVGQQAASLLYSAGHKQQAAEIMQLIGERIKGNADFASVADSLLVQAKMIYMDFESKMEAAMKGEPNAVVPLIQAIRDLAGVGEPGAMVYELTSRAGQNLEITGNYAASTQMYQLLGELFGKHSNADLAQRALLQAQNGVRRAALIGKPFQVVGNTVDGQTFDWNAYKGKVVLVDFWATWCGPCLGEIPNIEKNFQAYRQRGFEVIGVNLDDNTASVENFLKQRPLQWPTVISADKQQQGFQNPLAVHCGIDSIPFLVLVNRQGIAVGLHVRGAELERRLAELLGPADVTGSTVPGSAGPVSSVPQSNPLR